LSGTFSATIGAFTAAACINCKPGRYSEIIGATTCSLCPPGWNLKS
jgi:hypothetical protein